MEENTFLAYKPQYTYGPDRTVCTTGQMSFVLNSTDQLNSACLSDTARLRENAYIFLNVKQRITFLQQNILFFFIISE